MQSVRSWNSQSFLGEMTLAHTLKASTEFLLFNQIYNSYVLIFISIIARCEKLRISNYFILHYPANALTYYGAYPLVPTIRSASYRAGFCFNFFCQYFM